MTAVTVTAGPVDLAWQAYQDTLATASRDYLAAVGEAQRHHDDDVRAAIDTYHTVERAAFQAYTMTERAAKRRYLETATAPAGYPPAPPAPPLAAPPVPRDAPGSGPWPLHPVFTPKTESEQ